MWQNIQKKQQRFKKEKSSGLIFLGINTSWAIYSPSKEYALEELTQRIIQPRVSLNVHGFKTFSRLAVLNLIYKIASWAIYSP